MKIGIFTDTFYPEINGVATSCLNLERELTARGHEVHVFAPRCSGWEAHCRPNIHYLPAIPLVVLKDRNVALAKYSEVRAAINLHLDVVHTNSEFFAGYLGLFVARVSGCALVHTYHTIWEDYTYYLTHGVADGAAQRFARKYSKWWCRRMDRVITPTEKTEALLRQYGVRVPIEVIPTGIDLSRFCRSYTPEQLLETRHECGVADGERVLLNIGRMAREKNLEQIMRVFPRLLETAPDVRFLLIGEGPLRERLQEMAQELGVAGKVSLVGAKPWEEIDRYYAIGDVFVSASHSETQGLTYIEALCSNLCVCAVRDPCLENVIEDRVSGILSGDGDEELLEALRRAFGEEGRRIAHGAESFAEPFSAPVFAQRVEACYEAALEDLRRANEA